MSYRTFALSYQVTFFLLPPSLLEDLDDGGEGRREGR